jgi:hypothetical protein
MVRVETESGTWLGFVPVDFLRDSVAEGSTFIRATVDEIRGDRFSARLPGHPVTAGVFEGSVARAVPLRAVQA